MTYGISEKKVSPHSELRSAKGMVMRRQDVVKDIGQEDSKGYAINNYRAMLMCLKECEKHHNNVMQVITDKVAGVALETSALVDYTRKWVAESERVLRDKWEATDGELDEIRSGIYV